MKKLLYSLPDLTRYSERKRWFLLLNTNLSTVWLPQIGPREHQSFGKNNCASPAEAVASYQRQAAEHSELERQENKEKSGVYLGSNCVNPVNGESLPIFVADYVLMGYGTGAVMSVPGQDQRDWDFAIKYEIGIVRTVQPPESFEGEAYTGDGPAINSGFLDGLEISEAKSQIREWLELNGCGEGTVTYKLRDWLFLSAAILG